MTVLDYRTEEIPPPVLADYCLKRGLVREEGTLRLRAVLQMRDRLVGLMEASGQASNQWVDGEGRVLFGRLFDDVDVLAGARQPGLFSPSQRDRASFLAVQFFPGGEENVSRLPAAWWATPLGVLCNRVLHVV
jgi:hypothetical protein